MRHSVSIRLLGIALFIFSCQIEPVEAISASASSINNQWLYYSENFEGIESLLSLSSNQLNADDLKSAISVDITTENDFQSESGFKISVTLTNRSNKPVEISADFPYIKFDFSEENEQKNKVSYIFPSRSTLLSDKPINSSGYYGTIHPLPFIGLTKNDLGGFYFIVDDPVPTQKRFDLKKDQSGKITLKTSYASRNLEPQESWTLPSVIIGETSSSNWKDIWKRYKKWWHANNQVKAANEKFLKSFYFRALKLYPNEVHSSTHTLREILDTERDIFGGIDFLHLYDWSERGVNRVGDYWPWKTQEEALAFAEEIEEVRNQDVLVGLYFEGYLASKESYISQSGFADAWQAIDKSGKLYTHWDHSDGKVTYRYLCPFVPSWQDFLAKKMAHAKKNLNIDGVYVDEFGFGSLVSDIKHCTNHLHEPYHPTDQFLDLNTGEFAMLKTIRNSLNRDTLLYVEAAPSDKFINVLDGAFVSSTKAQVNRDADLPPINMFRFTFPRFKLFELITEKPLTKSFERELTIALFNGIGLYISGKSSALSNEMSEILKKNYKYYSEFKNAFSSEDIEPLINTGHSKIFANQFTDKKQTVWTVLNNREANFKGIINLEKSKQHTCYFLINDDMTYTPIDIRKQELTIDAKDLIFIVGKEACP